MNDVDIMELINRRRRQVLVHSCIYYRYDSNIIDDHTYDEWSRELAELQRSYPRIAEKCVYAKEFEDFDGSTGFGLPIHQPDIVNKANQLKNIHRKRTKRE